MKFSVTICLLFIAIVQLSHCFPKELLSINSLQEKLLSNAKPIVDTAKEAELCCNTVTHELGKKFVDMYSKVSSFAASALQFPKQKVLDFGKGLTQTLDLIGGKLVGLM
ncbi:uncharacterized protein LOC106669780 [Cimex lectularius]|uniref:Uncharacterized protein n=1 Tax=Cimex lectularius TaxID=79782 RepID=A0A8I6S117_CIMLE|nr:uncharacterized protein LOC106669780 [Cimex lectularius]